MVKSEDYMLLFLVFGFAIFSVMQMRYIPNYWAQYAMGTVVFLVAMLSTIAITKHFRIREELD